ncbi:MAG: polysaccharide deacetylase family protein [Nitrospirota bacterium]
MRTIPVFMYHHVSPHKGDMVSVTPDVFESQMQFLNEKGYKTLSADELVRFMQSDIAMPRPSFPFSTNIREQKSTHEKAVAITFDDGYLDNYIFAFPILKRYNIKVAIFVVIDWVEEASKGQGVRVKGQEVILPFHHEGKELIAKGQSHKVIMNWDMIKEMQESGLVEFYSHTMSHSKCSELSDEKLIRELEGSKRVLEQRLSKPCQYLCWPKGLFNISSVNIAKKAGYTALFTTKRGVTKTHSDRFCIERIVVKNSVNWFKNRVRIYTNPLLSNIYLSVRGKR